MKIKNTGKEIMAASTNISSAILRIVESDKTYDWLESMSNPSNRQIGIPVGYLVWLPDTDWIEIPNTEIVRRVL
jgi:hypothetical protein